MNPNNVNQVLDALAARLSVPAAHLWGVLVRQAAVEFWTQVAVAVVLGGVFAIAFRQYRAEVALRESYNDRDLAWFIVAMFTGAVFFLAACIAVSNIGYLVNPEYYALHQLLGVFK